uniref:Uncharacterized protein n=1 Tax=Cacopsylla melanoneura TaxID=428564 RepID=A0A8D8LMW1_9HEMI
MSEKLKAQNNTKIQDTKTSEQIFYFFEIKIFMTRISARMYTLRGKPRDCRLGSGYLAWGKRVIGSTIDDRDRKIQRTLPYSTQFSIFSYEEKKYSRFSLIFFFFFFFFEIKQINKHT